MSLATERKLKNWLRGIVPRDVESGQVYLAADSDGMPLQIFYDALGELDVVEVSGFLSRVPPEAWARAKFFDKLCDLAHVVLSPRRDAGLDDMFGITMREGVAALAWVWEGTHLSEGDRAPRGLKKFLALRRRLREVLRSDFVDTTPPPLPPGVRVLMP